jgi:DUF1707 SHOCT-like domain/Domain of unknown function (DUF4190)
MAMQYGGGLPPQPGRMRASSADRDRAVDVLKAAFAEGRLSRAEYEQRTGLVLRSRTYADLAQLTADLPAGPFGGFAAPPGAGLAPVPMAMAMPARPRLNSLAVTSLVLSLLVAVAAPASLVMGLAARRQIRQTGERGDGMATAAIVLSACWLALFVVYGISKI